MIRKAILFPCKNTTQVSDNNLQLTVDIWNGIIFSNQQNKKTFIEKGNRTRKKKSYFAVRREKQEALQWLLQAMEVHIYQLSEELRLIFVGVILKLQSRSKNLQMICNCSINYW